MPERLSHERTGTIRLSVRAYCGRGYSRTFEVIGHSVCIDDETLAEAISALPVDRRDIILLSYFLDMSDAEIANVLNMVRRSVAYRRTSTLKLLKNLMGGENR